ncbi:MAG: hypothetical protein RBS50_08980 [Phenylobacterium sp.]|uniref:hypothetical protein n=1 Tax=Phenylobacterium sp. TaxID=1871053 RepID=UPI002A35D675|nr:hypothetical protein [Phenylobacterium sp.]MDX9998081.1 hypothetical protein [Phenylobacterium sp.]
MRGCGAILLLGLGLLIAPAAARADAAPIATRPALAVAGQAQPFTEDDLLLLEVSAGGRLLAEALPAYAAPAGVYLPLGELARLLEIAVAVDPNRARAEGWVLSEERRFRLDLLAAEAEAAGRGWSLAPEDAVLAQGEIWVRPDRLADWLPLKLKADVRSLTLAIEALEPLPFQARLEREARRQRLELGGRSAARAETFVPTPYVAFSPPAVDVTVSAAREAENMRTRYDLRLAGDLAWAGLQAFVTGDGNGGLTQARVLLERKDPERRMALVPGISRVSLGDTYTPSLPLGPRSAGGRGLSLTTEDFQEIGAFDQIDLRGDLERDWEVELYVDDVLRGSRKEEGAGEYAFEDVPLMVGLNVIRLVFYGPQGERREEVRRLHVAGDAVRQGEWLVRFGAVDEGASVIAFHDDPQGEGDHLLDVGDRPRRLAGPRGLRAVGHLAYGVAPGASLSAGLASFHDLVGRTHTQAGVGAGASVLGFAAQANLAADDGGGTAASLGVAGRIGRVALVARHAEFSGGFLDEGGGYMRVLEPSRRSSTLSVDTTLKLGRRPLPVGLRVSRDEFAGGDAHLLATGRASTSLGRFLLSGAVRYEREDKAARGDGRVSGLITASGLIDDHWRVRATAAWDQDAVATVSLDRRWGEANALRLGLSHRWGDHAATMLQASHVWRLRNLDLSLFGGWSGADGETRIGVQLATALVFDGERYRRAPPGAAAGGAMRVHAFLDADGDGRWRPGEAPAAGLGVRGGRRVAETDAEGRALITGLGDGARAAVQIDASAVEDPYVTTPPPRLVFVPRPGRVAEAAFPLQQTGEVVIEVALHQDGEPPRPLSAVRLQVVDAAGAVAAEGRTAFDGALVVGGLRPGDYRLRIDPEQAATLGLTLNAAPAIHIPREGGFVGEVAAAVRLGATSILADTAPEPPQPALGQDRAGSAPERRPHASRSLGARLLRWLGFSLAG